MAVKKPSPTKLSPKAARVVIRPPVVAVLGHVDHGKTTLLDAIRQTNVVASEYGGMTQHIGAYQVTVPLAGDQGKESKITFIDTPGHAAFAKMRARGAQVTDIAILVVAANDGVKPQTVEAIDHIKAAGVAMIVAVNKIDLPEAQVDKTYQQLAEHGVVVESYGGKVPAVEVSATKKQGLKNLLEMILLVAGLKEIKADLAAPLAGVVIESRLDVKKGSLATILIHNGTLRTNETIYAGQARAKVRALIDANGQRLQEALPSTPVKVLGFDQVPEVGVPVSGRPGAPAATVAGQEEGRPARSRNQEFTLIIRADVEGTKEAVRDAIERLEIGDLKIKILSASTGEITESDIFLAQATQAVVVGFNVGMATAVPKLAESQGVIVKTYQVIYELIDEIEAAARGLSAPEAKILGKGEVLKTFQGTKAVIAGIKVTEGSISIGDRIRFKRAGKVVGEAKLTTVHQLKKKVKRTEAGGECGATFDAEIAFRGGDIVESYRDIK